jgi:dTDP-4-amino-4,6-dideoxygalactose transaminase/nucleoside-diphosphate-sugar epimerase
MEWVVAGGSGFVGDAICRVLVGRGDQVTVVDRQRPRGEVDWIAADLLTDDFELPPGRIVLAQGRSMPRPVRPWTLVLDNTVGTARLAPRLAGRAVTLLSTIEVYGPAPGPLTEQTVPALPRISPEWLERLRAAATRPCPPHEVVGLCRELSALDASGRWVYALSKRAQELLLPEGATVLRLSNVVGPGQWRLVGRLVDAIQHGLPCRVTDTVRSFVGLEDVAHVVADLDAPGVFNVTAGTVALRDVVRLIEEEVSRPARATYVAAPQADSCGVVDGTLLASVVKPFDDVVDTLRHCVQAITTDPAPMFDPALPVVLPPRPEEPDLVATRMATALWTGQVRGARWTEELVAVLRSTLQVPEERGVVATNSGTNALRLAVSAVARPGGIAICPAFTFHASAEVLRQLGYAVRFVDIDARTWTLDPTALTAALAREQVSVVVAVDALGNPADYPALSRVCADAGVPLVADSAAGLGALTSGVPVGTQVAAHAYSLSFAKVVSAGGSGGAVVLAPDLETTSPANWLRSSPITEISAVVGLDGLRALETLVRRRSVVADIYRDALPALIPQHVRDADRHSWVHWTARVPAGVDRGRFAVELAAEGIGCKPYYEPIDGMGGSMPVADALHAEALALPMSSELTVDDAERVATGARRALRRLGI